MHRAVVAILLGLAGLAGTCSAAAPAEATLPGLLRHEAPAYPLALRGVLAGEGSAIVVMTIGETGVVLDQLALQASLPEFARSAEAAVAGWRFDTGHSDSRPRREVVQFDFKRSGVLTTLNHVEAARQAFQIATETGGVSTVQWSDLPHKPQRLQTIMPRLPRTSMPPTAEFVVSFIVDATGRVRVPVVNRSANPEVDQAVLAAVGAWRFEPATFDGRAVQFQHSARFNAQP